MTSRTETPLEYHNFFFLLALQRVIERYIYIDRYIYIYIYSIYLL